MPSIFQNIQPYIPIERPEIRAYPETPSAFRWSAPGLLIPDNECCFVADVRARQFESPQHEGWLSIKFTFRGREKYSLGKRTIAVDENAFLLLNAGQEYSSLIDSHSTVESLSFFFSPSFVSDTMSASSLNRTSEPDEKPTGMHSFRFFDQLHFADEKLLKRAFSIRALLESGKGTNLWFSETLADMFETILKTNCSVFNELQKVPAVRKSTRLDLYRRIQTAREYIESNYYEPLMLNDCASAACLSPFRFLRLFRQTLQVTPHQYLIRKRIERARRLLEESDQDVAAICLEVGFSSATSFSTLFRERTGSTPTAYRVASRAKKRQF